MTLTDTLGLGFMTFAFFLGAGNLIFPPFAGMLAGENMPMAMIGFLITAVGLPLIGLIAVAKAKGKIMSMLPAFAATALAVSIYIIIGPAFAAPRTGLVAYEIGARPFIENPDAILMLGGLSLNVAQLIYSFVFFGIVMVLSLFPGKLLDNVGKVLTPILILLLIALALSVLIIPGSEVGAPTGDYQHNALIKGFVEGYNTMDTLASLMFGMLIIDLLRKKGINESGQQTKYLIRAAVIAASGLAFVYISLFFLGATAGELGAGVDNGGQILTNYVSHEFGTLGTVMLSTVVTLACLTTAVGLVSACSDFFSELLPKISYKQFAVFFSLVCATIANVGLSELIKISIPVLMTVYPVAIALVLVTFLTRFYPNPQFAHRAVLAIALFFGIFDGIKAAGFEVNIFNWIPLQSEGMAWAIPTLLVMVACLFIPKAKTAA
ncbi:branched-chain amino acid transport system II carrier protein [Shewanella intestini]|uniref:Branched-chain amino acid transport system carrier protein n=1 Tax=Shewanella intestini TaxID=2017544 RepID=A0ABS5I5W1_9GAMM|nr:MULTISPECIES: branched-chain amino acid transport system II carrier protein [Shewanella]MBR9729420.1 branched-chain amino acid transport system II carrier protein [Shewanella intestini]MRG37500.1 branched-chain amino acid transport system II carrier protein [Shewanella sp. XMDDZSB0408]